jgi:hypothetical protein
LHGQVQLAAIRQCAIFRLGREGIRTILLKTVVSLLLTLQPKILHGKPIGVVVAAGENSTSGKK